MPRLIRNRAIANDRYTLLRDAASLADVPDGVPVLVPLALLALTVYVGFRVFAREAPRVAEEL